MYNYIHAKDADKQTKKTKVIKMKVYTLTNAKTNLHSIAKEVSETDTKVYIIAKNKKLLVLMPVTPDHFKGAEPESNS